MSKSDAMIAEELKARLSDPAWRLENLYKIMIKGKPNEPGLVRQFKPNAAQSIFLKNLWYSNVILKSRQLGFTTLIAILWLDHALFNSNSRCGIIAQNKDAASVIFRDKVKFAYENLPQSLKDAMPLARDSADELLFAHNNSSVRVSTSMRSGTIHRLHVSEFGKICAEYPAKAREVITGSIPAVPVNGILVIESTAEGPEGKFYDIAQEAIALAQKKAKLTERDYRFHFFGWTGDPDCFIDPAGIVFTEKDTAYFDSLEAKLNITLSLEQRAWYVKTRDSRFTGDQALMWQEYPSTPEEAFQVSTEGCYYTDQIAAVRKSGRVCNIPVTSQPVNTFWDIGRSDGTAIWFHQLVGKEDRFIKYIEAHGEDLTFYARELQRTGYVFNKHFLPHDAEHKRLSDTNKSTKEMLEDLGIQNIEIIPRISDINTGIQMVRECFPSVWFDEAGTKDGFKRLENYKKKWNAQDGRWSNEPRHDSNSEGSDAFRQWAQAKVANLITDSGSWRSMPKYAITTYPDQANDSGFQTIGW